MTNDRVADWMTADPVTITADLGIGVAHQMMRMHECRRLPVVDDNDRLIGIVTLSDIREAGPKSDGKLSLWEVHYRLATTEVRDVMSSAPRSVQPSTPILEAALMMLDDKIGGLPVIDNGQLVGIITESDIFRFLVRELSPHPAART